MPTSSSTSLGVQHSQHLKFTACAGRIKFTLLHCSLLQPQEQAHSWNMAIPKYSLTHPLIHACTMCKNLSCVPNDTTATWNYFTCLHYFRTIVKST